MSKINSFLVLLLFLSCDHVTSPDSSSTPSGEILFMSIRNGHTIILADQNGSNEFALTNVNEDHEGASFSPDGKKVMFSAFVSGSRSIYIFDIHSLQKTKITDDTGNDSSPSFSHDGSKIVFTSSRNNDQGYSNIFLLDLETMQLTQLTDADRHHYDPIFSPNASKILFHRLYDGMHQLAIIDTNGTSLTEIATSRLFFSNFEFSAVENRIYYEDEDTGNVVSSGLDGTDTSVVVADSSEDTITFVLSPAGPTLYYCTFQRASDVVDKYTLYKLDLNTHQTTILKQSSEFLYLGDCSYDGSKLLYQQFIDGNGDIFLMDLRGGTDRNITTSEFHDHSGQFNNSILN